MQKNLVKINNKIRLLNNRIAQIKKENYKCEIKRIHNFDVVKDKDDECESYYKETLLLQCEIERMIRLRKYITSNPE